MTAAGPVVMRGGRWRGLGCWLRGHRWCAGTTARAEALVLCERCGEIVAQAFVHGDHVLGLAAVGQETRWGPLGVVLDAVNTAAAVVRFDDQTHQPLRARLVARPGPSVDALSELAATLSRMVDPARPDRALMRVALAAEMSAVEFAVATGGDGAR